MPCNPNHRPDKNDEVRPSRLRLAQMIPRCVIVMALVLTGRDISAQEGRNISGICDQAALAAARRHDVPPDVMFAITRTETGRLDKGKLRPWPWTVNMEGVGRWFETADAARAYVFANFKRGARSFDVGCFQINFKWHGAAFGSIEEMFDPHENADYAARFLAKLYAELGNWSQAAGAYHSRTPEFASRYSARFDRIRTTNLPDVPERRRPRAAFGPPRRIEFDTRLADGPLIGAGSAKLGSLVPTSRSIGQTGPRLAFFE